MERDAKLENYALAVKNNRSDAEQLGEEIKRLQARKKSAEHRAERYKRQKPAEPDKTAIRKALVAGIAVPGAELVRRKNLQIK